MSDLGPLGFVVDTRAVEGVGAVSLVAHIDDTWDVIQTDPLGHILAPCPSLVCLTEQEARKEFDEASQWLAWTGTRAARAAAADLNEEGRRGR